MKLLISSVETTEAYDGTVGFRVLEAKNDEDTFPVASSLSWVDAPSGFTVPEQWYVIDDVVTKKPINPDVPDFLW